ncbi:NAD-binding protein [Streptomyces sp. Act143]
MLAGGVRAVELATAWQELGSHVTLLVRGNGLLRQGGSPSPANSSP